MSTFNFAGFTWPRACATLPTGPLKARARARKRSMCGPSYRSPTPNSRTGWGFYEGSNDLFSLREETRGKTYRWSDHWDAIEAIVYRLPKGRGFLAGHTMGEGMSAGVDSGVFTDLADAVARANDEAEHVACKESEGQYLFDAMQAAENAVDHAESELQDCLALRRMGRRTTDDAAEAVQAVRDARENLIEATADYERGVS